MPSRASSSAPCRPSRDRGYVTAEAAVVLPVLVVLLGMLLWGLGAVAAQARCGDAARAGARAAARGEAAAAVERAARATAPEGARVRVAREDDLVRVTVDARTPGPGPLAVRVSGEVVARAEPE
ncbi:TadE family type IV pilus minor pilin [Streptomyces sp. DSM 44917]|uniref:TadE family type IV pilus minor pilin n=1 Tax=Streptomyces boetiae TaxID=3075541 RepID=A0ABU2LAA1_9ACTN|nr:TadE family type IV pilus minor pilin [Streptomyces sp. DSM 44917]MDT0308411.1 TadE family type IV pilus minor pilin [Streptomyces sp. DSM 44917]